MATVGELELIIKANSSNVDRTLEEIEGSAEALSQSLSGAFNIDVNSSGSGSINTLANDADQAASKIQEAEQAAATLGTANVGNAGIPNIGDAAAQASDEIQDVTEKLGGLESNAASAGGVAQREARQATEAVERLDDALGGAEQSTSFFETALAGLAASQLDSLVGGIEGFFDSAIEKATNADAAFRTLQQIIANTGGTAGVTAEEVRDFASDLADATLTSQGAVVRASTALLSFKNINRETFFEAITLAQDLAQTYDSDLEETIIQVGEALNVPSEGLAGLGDAATNLEFGGELQAEIEKLEASGDILGAQELILDALAESYREAGTAAAGGLAGAVDTLGENADDIQRAIGSAIIPALTDFTNLLIGLQPQLESLAQTLGSTIGVGLDLLGKALKFASENTEILEAALQVLLVRFVALKTVALVNAIQATTLALAAQTSTSLFLVNAQGALVLSTAKLKVALLALGTAVAPILAIGAAVLVVKRNINILQTELAQIDIDSFIQSSGVSLDNANAAANRTLLLTDEINALRERGAQLSQEELNAAQRLADANDIRLEGLRENLQIAEALNPKTEEQERAQVALVNQYETGIAALENQNARLREATGIVEEIANVEPGQTIADSLGGVDVEAVAQEQANARIEAVRQANAVAQREIELAQTEEIEAVRRSQAERVISAEEAEQQIEAIRSRARDAELSEIAAQQEQINSLLTAGDITEVEATSQRAELEQQAADIRINQIDAEIAAQEALADAEQERLEDLEEAEQERLDDALDAIDERIAAEQRVAEAGNLALDAQTGALERQSSLLTAQSDLRSTQLDLTNQLLQGELAEAEAAGQTAEAERIRAEILDNEQAQLNAQFEARAAQLELTQQQTELDLQRQSIQASIATLEAQAAIQQAELNGASAAELETLQQILGLRQQQESAIADQQAQQGQLNELAREQLATEREIAQARQDQSEASAESAAASSASAAGSSAGGSVAGGATGGGLFGSQVGEFRAAQNRASDIIERGGGVADLSRLFGQFSSDIVTRVLASVPGGGEVATLIDTVRRSDSAQGQALALEIDKLAKGGSQADLANAIGEVRNLAQAIQNQPRSVSISAADPLGEVGNVLGRINSATAGAAGI